jgi:hypothetical protein
MSRVRQHINHRVMLKPTTTKSYWRSMRAHSSDQYIQDHTGEHSIPSNSKGSNKSSVDLRVFVAEQRLEERRCSNAVTVVTLRKSSKPLRRVESINSDIVDAEVAMDFSHIPKIPTPAPEAPPNEQSHGSTENGAQALTQLMQDHNQYDSMLSTGCSVLDTQENIHLAAITTMVG